MKGKLTLSVVRSPSMQFETFASRTRPFLFTVLAKYCRGIEHELDDLVQDVLLRALLHWEQQLKNLEEEARRGWLARVAHNCFLDRCRRKASEARRVGEAPRSSEHSRQDEDLEPELWEFISSQDLKQGLEQLKNDKERRAFELHLQGLSYAEIGAQMGARPGTVGAWLTKARVGLRELLRATAEQRRTERSR